MIIGKCLLCDLEKELCNSHAIGDSIFRKAFKQDSGKGVMISADDSNACYTSDSFASPQLCKKCEKDLNEKYEKYGLSFLRGRIEKPIRSSLGVHFKHVDHHILRMYFLSIYWRAASSNHSGYSKVRSTEAIHRHIKSALKGEGKVIASRCSVQLFRIIDSKYCIPDETIKSIIAAPYCANAEEVKVRGYISFHFIFEGFLIEINFGNFSFKKRKAYGFLSDKHCPLVVPYKEIDDLPVILDTLALGIHKERQGRTNIK